MEEDKEKAYDPADHYGDRVSSISMEETVWM